MPQDYFNTLVRLKDILDKHLERNQYKTELPGVDSRSVPDEIVAAGLLSMKVGKDLEEYSKYCYCKGRECRICSQSYCYWYPGEELPSKFPDRCERLSQGRWVSADEEEYPIGSWYGSCYRWIKGGDNPWETSYERPFVSKKEWGDSIKVGYLCSLIRSLLYKERNLCVTECEINERADQILEKKIQIDEDTNFDDFTLIDELDKLWEEDPWEKDPNNA